MGFDTANPLGELSTNLQFTPGGNPYADVTPAGLANSYGQTYNSALAANQANYNNVISGYKSLAGNVAKQLGQGGSWGIATPAAQAIEDTRVGATGGAIQNSINRGLGGSTAAVAAQRGANLDASKAYASLGSQLAQTNAGYTTSLGQGMLAAMQNTNVPYPNGAEYANLYQQYGQAQASQQNMAFLGQQQQAQREAATRAANQALAYSRLPSGSAGVAAAPRGGTYGSGGGGFPSGGGSQPMSANGYIGNPNAFAGGASSGGYTNYSALAGQAIGSAVGAGINMSGFGATGMPAYGVDMSGADNSLSFDMGVGAGY